MGGLCARAGMLSLALWIAVGPSTALAGRRPYIWTWDTELVPEGDVELEQWLWARGRAPGESGRPAAYWVWWGPVLGLSSHVELALPFQVLSTGLSTALESFEADLRLRLWPRESAAPFQPLLRVAYHQAIHTPAPSRIDANVVASYQLEGGLRLNADVGARLGVPLLRGDSGPVQLVLTWGAGASYPVAETGLRLSAEAFAEHGAASAAADLPHLFVGPSVSWTRGRVWLTAGALVGLTPLYPQTPSFMPRLIWAVAL